MAALTLAIAGCSGAPNDTDELVVFAAASLTSSFREIETAFETAHPDISVTLNLAGSSQLATQIADGAPADVFAAADTVTMDRVDRSNNARIFAHNRPQILVPSGNPLGLDGLDDLTDDHLTLVVCAPEVPCGSYAEMMFAAADLDIHPDSWEPNAAGVVTKIASGEADVGIAYATDALANPDIDALALPDSIDIAADYPIAMITADNPSAQAFIDFVLSPDGQAILSKFGFESP